MDLLLAHDLGTTGNKASLFDTQGQLVASQFVPYETRYPRPGWAEQDAADWWRAVVQASRALLATKGPAIAGNIAAISFSGQMMGCLPLDAAGQPLRTAIIWADQRATAQADRLGRQLGAEHFYQLTGHRPGASYTAAKAMWLQDEQPDLWRQTARLLQAKDYIAYRLCGEQATDYSDASGTNLYGLGQHDWADEILAAANLSRSLLPCPVPAATVIGRVTAAAAQATGLRQGTPVVIGGGDGGCATVGAGVTRPGASYCYLGSSSWISFASPEPLYDPQQRTFTFAHLDPALYFPTGTMQTAGAAYDWLGRLLTDQPDELALAELDALAATTPPGADGLLFLPYLMGERSPHWNPQARAAFVGLTMVHGRGALARAVMEGVAHNLHIILDAFLQQGASIESLRLIGGGARSAVWRQILASVLGVPIASLGLDVAATSLGAAIAAGMGIGLFPSYAVADQMATVSAREEVDAQLAERYGELGLLFADAYSALETISANLQRICTAS